MKKYFLLFWMVNFAISSGLAAKALVPMGDTTRHRVDFRGQIEALADSSIPKASFRGLSVVDDQIVWVSGSKGNVGKSCDGGKTWSWISPKGFEKRDFRDIEAFDSLRAVIACVGAPALVLRTDDGGKHWTETYRNEDTLMFLDGIDFWDDQHGIIFGDPIQGHLFVMTTNDGGKTWQEIPRAQCPDAVPGEAAFAASGTTIRTLPNGKVFIATGGKRSRLWYSKDYGQHWKAIETPIIQGGEATGIFSFAVYDSKHIVIVGGDYTQDSLCDRHVFITQNGGKTWQKPSTPTTGYRSCVEYINKKRIIATGTNGTDLSFNGGKDWQKIDKRGYHAVRKAKKGSLIFFSGNKGAIAQLKQ